MNQETFPYRDLEEINQAVQEELEDQIFRYHCKADLAFREGKYRLHSLYCHCANRLTGMLRAYNKK